MPGVDAFPTSHQLELIAAVAQHGGVSAAAEALSISQPAVTAQLRAAEHVIGHRLFVRTRAGLVPTPAGRAVAAFARRQNALRRGLMASMADLAEGKAGALAVGASSAPAERWLPLKLTDLRNSFPGINVTVITGNSQQMLEQLENGDIDVAAVGVRQRTRGLKFAEVASDRIAAVAARGSRLARGLIRARTLADAAFIVREEGSATRECGLRCLKRVGVSPKRLMPQSTNEAVARMAAADLGVGLLSQQAAQHHVDEGRLAYVRIAGWKCRRRLYVARRTDVPNPLVDLFWKAAVAETRR